MFLLLAVSICLHATAPSDFTAMISTVLEVYVIVLSQPLTIVSKRSSYAV